MPQFPTPDERNPLADDCRRCGDLVGCRDRIAWGVGPRDAAVVVVGEAPAAGDSAADRWRGGNRTGMAYTSLHSGRRIRDVMERAGHPDAYYTNGVKCFPCDGDGSNREPTAAERENCRPYLLREVEQVGPDWVVTTGSHATRSVLAVDGRAVGSFLDLVLEPVECPTLGVRVLPLLHPSYLEVWLSRLGYTEAEYVGAIRERLG